MTYIATIKEGISTVHRNWQLILVQFASMFLSCLSFFVIVGIPIAVAFVMFGLDLTEILRLKDVVSAFKGSAGLLHRYFGMALIIIISLLVYLAFIVVLWIFTVAGIVGMLAEAVAHGQRPFSIGDFFREGKRLFFPVFLFSIIIAIIFISLAFVLGILGGGASAIIDMAKSQEATLGLFLGVFFSLVLLSAGLVMILLTLSVTIYGIADMVFNRSKPLSALKDTVRYLYSRPAAIGFYGVLLLGYMVAGFIVILVGTPLALIPIVGSLLAIPYQFVTYIIQGYVSLIMLSSIFHYYYKTRYVPTLPLSTGDQDTSRTSESGQARPPGETEGNPPE